MKLSFRLLGSTVAITPCLAAIALTVGCSSDGPRDFDSNGGKSTTGTGGMTGANPSGGTGAHAGTTGSGGTVAAGGGFPVAGSGQGGQATVGGSAGTHSGGAGAGAGSGGRSGGAGGKSGGTGGSSGGASGGKAGASGTGAAGGSPVDGCSVTTTPTGGVEHKTSNQTGKAAGLEWALWSNGSGGSITTYEVPAFSAMWANSGDFLARLGLQWNATKTYDQYGTITAEFAYKKTGTGGGYSYIGMYGWSVSPCVEWYIVDDSYNTMPVNPGSTTNKGTADIDGGKYNLYTRNTTGTGGSKCSGVTSWVQFYSVRQKARQCGQISLTEHFAAWAAAGMTLGKMDQAQILVEVGGGSGTIDFTVANVTASM